jgi:hypothetical protein
MDEQQIKTDETDAFFTFCRSRIRFIRFKSVANQTRS